MDRVVDTIRLMTYPDPVAMNNGEMELFLTEYIIVPCPPTGENGSSRRLGGAA